MGRRLIAFAVIAWLAGVAPQAEAKLSYDRALRMATHSARLFNLETWDAKIIWSATFFSDAFRRAFDEMHIEVNHLDEEAEVSRFLDEQQYRQNSGWDFVVSMYAKKDYKKFSLENDSFWKVSLVTASGEEVRPVAIDALPITPYEQVMFRHLSRWTKLYRVTFPKVDLGDTISLTIESVIGASTMSWRLKERGRDSSGAEEEIRRSR